MDITEILNNDLTGVSTSYPVLPTGTYSVRITSLKVVPTKDNRGHVMEQIVALEAPANDIEGKPVSVGHTVTDRFSLTVTEKYPSDRIERRLKNLREAVHGKNCSGAFGNPEQYVGQTVSVRLEVEEDENGVYPPKNRIARYIPKS